MNILQPNFLLSNEFLIASVRLTRAWLMEWLARNPNCKLYSFIFSQGIIKTLIHDFLSDFTKDRQKRNRSIIRYCQ